jgi:hypothetical protein
MLPLDPIWWAISQSTSWQRFVGGHFEYRMHGDVGQYAFWERREPCQKDKRDGWQKGSAVCREFPGVGVRRHWRYLSYVARHKWFVFQAGREAGIPWLAALHDNSKFSPREWLPYARHFYRVNGMFRTRIAADGFFQDEDDDQAFDAAWLLHSSRNKHHPQFWVEIVWTPCDHGSSVGSSEPQILLEDDGHAKCLECGSTYSYGESLLPSDDHVVVQIREMPLKYRQEMLCDWIGAGAAQGTPDTAGWYKARGYRLPLGPDTRRWVEQALKIPRGWQRIAP